VYGSDIETEVKGRPEDAIVDRWKGFTEDRREEMVVSVHVCFLISREIRR